MGYNVFGKKSSDKDFACTCLNFLPILVRVRGEGDDFSRFGLLECLRVFNRSWKPGDWIVYRMSKHGIAPGKRAHHVSASRKGESYNYIVDKFWVIEKIGPNGELYVRTPGGKTRVLASNDLNIRRARWWHRFQWGERFRTAEAQRLQQESLTNGHQHGGPAEAA